MCSLRCGKDKEDFGQLLIIRPLAPGNLAQGFLALVDLIRGSEPRRRVALRIRKKEFWVVGVGYRLPE